MSTFKTIICYLLALFFFVAGITHFTQDEAYAGIVPPLLPFPFLIVWVTGIMELFFALGLAIKKFRKMSGFWLAPFLLAVLPANIYMAMYNIPLGDMESSPKQRFGLGLLCNSRLLRLSFGRAVILTKRRVKTYSGLYAVLNLTVYFYCACHSVDAVSLVPQSRL